MADASLKIFTRAYQNHQAQIDDLVTRLQDYAGPEESLQTETPVEAGPQVIVLPKDLEPELIDRINHRPDRDLFGGPFVQDPVMMAQFSERSDYADQFGREGLPILEAISADMPTDNPHGQIIADGLSRFFQPQMQKTFVRAVLSGDRERTHELLSECLVAVLDGYRGKAPLPSMTPLDFRFEDIGEPDLTGYGLLNVEERSTLEPQTSDPIFLNLSDPEGIQKCVGEVVDNIKGVDRRPGWKRGRWIFINHPRQYYGSPSLWPESIVKTLAAGIAAWQPIAFDKEAGEKVDTLSSLLMYHTYSRPLREKLAKAHPIQNHISQVTGMIDKKLMQSMGTYAFTLMTDEPGITSWATVESSDKSFPAEESIILPSRQLSNGVINWSDQIITPTGFAYIDKYEGGLLTEVPRLVSILLPNGSYARPDLVTQVKLSQRGTPAEQIKRAVEEDQIPF